MATKAQSNAQQPVSGTTTITTAQSASKAEKARAIFGEMQNSPRKDVVARFVTDAGLTEKGAATYYQNFRKEAGLVHNRVEPASTQATGRAAPSGRR
jgi:hypothetical protein